MYRRIFTGVRDPEYEERQDFKMTLGADSPRLIGLPKPALDGEISVESALRSRRSVRDFVTVELSLQQVSHLLWAAQGETARDGSRTAPSAGALYPLETYLAVGTVQGLEVGVYHYRPHGHALVRVVDGEQRPKLARAALEQYWISEAGIVIVLCAVYGRTTRKYGERGRMYVHMEAGHVVQSISLEAVAVGLGSTVVGAFEEESVRRILHATKRQVPLCLVAVGKPA
jgi:SagB-type dehydrogenase family enzyme